MKRFYALVGQSVGEHKFRANLIFWSDEAKWVLDLKHRLNVPDMNLRTLEVLLWKEVGELSDYFKSLATGLAFSILEESTVIVSGHVPYLVWGAKDSGVVQVLNLPKLSISENAKLATSMVEIRYPQPGDRIVEGFDSELTMYVVVMATGPEHATQLGQLILQQITDNDEWRGTTCF